MYSDLMNDEPRKLKLSSIDPGPGGILDQDRWRMVNSNYNLITELIAGLQSKVAALEVEVAELRAAKGVGDDDAPTD